VTSGTSRDAVFRAAGAAGDHLDMEATSRGSSKYAPSPLAQHERAVRTAGALLLLEIGPETINFEIRRQYGFTEGQAAQVVREAARLIPRIPRGPLPRAR
jgi:hypothetical protein